MAEALLLSALRPQAALAGEKKDTHLSSTLSSTSRPTCFTSVYTLFVHNTGHSLTMSAALRAQRLKLRALLQQRYPIAKTLDKIPRGKMKLNSQYDILDNELWGKS